MVICALKITPITGLKLCNFLDWVNQNKSNKLKFGNTALDRIGTTEIQEFDSSGRIGIIKIKNLFFMVTSGGMNKLQTWW